MRSKLLPESGWLRPFRCVALQKQTAVSQKTQPSGKLESVPVSADDLQVLQFSGMGTGFTFDKRRSGGRSFQ